MPYLSHRDDIETLEPGESIDGIIKGMTQESQRSKNAMAMPFAPATMRVSVRPVTRPIGSRRRHTPITPRRFMCACTRFQFPCLCEPTLLAGLAQYL